MPKFFGEYLVENDIITHEDLLEALVEQVSNTPSVVEIFYEKRMLPCEYILAALNHQSRHETDFLGALKALNLCNEELLSQLRAHLLECRKPLGQILISRKKIDVMQLTHALDEFVQDASEEHEATGGASEDEPQPSGTSTLDGNDRSKVDSQMVQKFIATMEGGLLDPFDAATVEADLQSLRQKILDMLLDISSAARFVRFDLFQKLAASLHSYLTEVKQPSSESVVVLVDGLSLLAEAYQELKKSGSDTSCFAANKSRFSAVTDGLTASSKESPCAS